MKRCAACRRVYDRDAVVCAVDGSSLDDFTSDPRAGQVIAKRYRLVQRLGSGSVGAVYLAVDLATAKRVAVKIFARELRCDEEALRQCRWDARFATASRPAGIVRVHDVDRTGEGQIFVAMDYLEGESLADLLQREGRLALVRALRLASQIAQALAAALNAGVVHSDIKPSNVRVVGPEQRQTADEAPVAAPEREPAPAAFAPRVAPHAAPVTVSRPADEPARPPRREREQRARWQAAWQACLGTERVLRERWHARGQGYRDQSRTQREAWQARWQGAPGAVARQARAAAAGGAGGARPATGRARAAASRSAWWCRSDARRSAHP